ncbi:Methyltransferase type 11 [Lasiodiplodia theobromae]|uniref:Methyltransferase type 11 n=1 Tax=Lasiodiplodia theobromae TaxID=45133 RepID=UPI0015C3ABE5|nr:Methyltransferase type 11 [Lasiodiplodia theobromae]KAF4545996.1 Methyltransferase type 11 [Lasiodiplodia theobromae]
MSSGTDRFNAEAAAWDSNPVTVRSSELAYEALLRHVPALTKEDSNQTLDVLEIGCGTGLLSTRLAPHVRTLLGVDLAGGMVAAFNAKVSKDQQQKLTNLTAIETLLTDPDQPEVQSAARALLSRSAAANEEGKPIRWHLLTSHLTLHHIPQLAPFLATCHASLRPGGLIALTDFEAVGPESVLFHPASKRADVERHGIDRGEIARLAREAGFVDVRVETAFVLEKEIEDPSEGVAGGRTRVGFPFLVVLGRKV